MDHGKLRLPVRKKRRTKENTSMSEKAKVGLADEATDVSKRSSREEKGSVKFGNSTAITAMSTETLLLSPIPMNRPTH